MGLRKVISTLLVCSACAAARNPPPSLTTIHYFSGGSVGGYPRDRVIIGPGGVLYGTTSQGGAYNFGTVYSIVPPASPGGAWAETLLHSFDAAAGDGGGPNGRLAMGTGGVLYGTTSYGGASCCGTVYQLTPPAAPGDAWAENVIYSFESQQLPRGGVTIGPAGKLYGVTLVGGSHGDGDVFVLTPPTFPGGSWTRYTLHSFGAGSDGSKPTADIVIGGGGVLYGTTSLGGTANAGTVFAVTPPASTGGAWTEAVLYNFAGGTDGSHPTSGVVIGSGGVLHGTTQDGGSFNGGTIYSLAPAASPSGVWTKIVPYDFPAVAGKTILPGPLALGENDTLYGVTGDGSTYGTALVLKPPVAPGGAWTEILLHTFTGGSDGGSPTGLSIGSGGVLYGTTEYGGGPSNDGEGTIFALIE